MLPLLSSNSLKAKAGSIKLEGFCKGKMRSKLASNRTYS